MHQCPFYVFEKKRKTPENEFHLRLFHICCLQNRIHLTKNDNEFSLFKTLNPKKVLEISESFPECFVTTHMNEQKNIVPQRFRSRLTVVSWNLEYHGTRLFLGTSVKTRSTFLWYLWCSINSFCIYVL